MEIEEEEDDANNGDVRLEQTVAGGVNGERGEGAITAVEFDQTGTMLAIGDKGGRVIVLKQQSDPEGGGMAQYAAHAEFKSHEPEFDYLKSLEIEEKINQIRFCGPCNSSTFLLSTNDKTIKLWKVGQRSIESVEVCNGAGGNRPRTASELRVPRVTKHGSVVSAAPKRVFSNAHAYHINSLSLNSDGETFVSSDDLRVNLWNLEVNDAAFNILDLKPANMEELNEVITSSALHPTDCSLLVYSSSKGTIKLFDMRDTALCRNHAKLLYENEGNHVAKSFFSEIVSSISDMRFTSDGRYIVSRDYLSLKLWDFRMESRPIRTVQVHDHLRSRLCELYEADCIFDKFECASSPNGDRCLTGSYSSNFSVFDYSGDRIDLNLDDRPGEPPAAPFNEAATPPAVDPQSMDAFDFRRRVLHLAWHPWSDVIAVAGIDKVHIYTFPPAPFRSV